MESLEALDAMRCVKDKVRAVLEARLATLNGPEMRRIGVLAVCPLP